MSAQNRIGSRPALIVDAESNTQNSPDAFDKRARALTLIDGELSPLCARSPSIVSIETHSGGSVSLHILLQNGGVYEVEGYQAGQVREMEFSASNIPAY